MNILGKMASLAVIVYLILTFAIKPPLPSSIVYLYMLFLLAGIFLHVTMDNARLEDFTYALARFLSGQVNKLGIVIWVAVLIFSPLMVARAIYLSLTPASSPPTPIRTVHPTPPQWIVGMENPLRKEAEEDDMMLLEYAEEGRILYDDICSACHGGNLDGKGPHAKGFDPPPADFTDIGTIAQLPESYVFWRIKEGGAGAARGIAALAFGYAGLAGRSK